MRTFMALAFVCAPTFLHAQTPNGEAKRLRDLAVAAKQRHDYQAALQYYRDALKVFDSPNLHYNLALVLKELGREAEALTEFQVFLASPLGDAGARPRALAEVEALTKYLPTPLPEVVSPPNVPPPVLVVKPALSPPKKRYRLPIGFGMGAVSVLAIGAGLYGSAVSDYGTLQDVCKLRLCGPSDWQGSEARQSAGIALLAVGGAAVMVDVALFAAKYKGRF